MEIKWKLRKIFSLLENIFTERSYFVDCNRFGVKGYNNTLIGKNFGYNKTIKCIESLYNIKINNFYKPLPLCRTILFKKYYPWYSLNKLINKTIIYIEKGEKEVKLGYISSIRRINVYGKNNKTKTALKANIHYSPDIIVGSFCESTTILIKDIIILGYFKISK